MKNILLTLLLFTVSAFAVPSADVGLQWDANDPSDNVIDYPVYELIGPGLWQPIGVATTTTFTVVGASIGKHTYAVVARSAVGESDKSNSVIANTARPNPPKGFRVFQITIKP